METYQQWAPTFSAGQMSIDADLLMFPATGFQHVPRDPPGLHQQLQVIDPRLALRPPHPAAQEAGSWPAGVGAGQSQQSTECYKVRNMLLHPAYTQYTVNDPYNVCLLLAMTDCCATRLSRKLPSRICFVCFCLNRNNKCPKQTLSLRQQWPIVVA